MSTETTENNNNSSPRRHSSDATTPLILTGGGDNNDEDGGGGGGRRSVRRQGLREAARLLRHASSGRMMMREPSMLVREAAAEQLEERQSDWAYSKPVVVLDFVWNLAFVAVAVAVLVLSSDEKPNTPLRVWIVGYGLQCMMHMVCVCVEYRRRNRRGRSSRSSRSRSSSSSSSSSMEEEEEGLGLSRRNSEDRYLELGQLESENNSFAKHLESANTMFSFIWWIILLGIFWWARVSTRISSALLVVYSLSRFRRVLCGVLRCIGVCYRHCCLLLLALHHCSSIRSSRTGRSFERRH